MKCIYLRTNTVNGKQYVGQTKHIDIRNNQWNCLKIPYSNKYINEERERYGLDNFKSEVIMECEDDEADYWEEYYIKAYNTHYPNGYNMSEHSTTKGLPLTEEAKTKLSEALKGREVWNKGKNGLQAAWNKGIPASEEQKEKQSIAMTGRISPRRKQVYQYTLDGELVKVWNSVMDCASGGFDYKLVSACCLGQRKKHKGFKWSYIKKEDIN